MSDLPKERDEVLETDLGDFDLIGEPLLNKGTAFDEEERDVFQLHGLLLAPRGDDGRADLAAAQVRVDDLERCILFLINCL